MLEHTAHREPDRAHRARTQRYCGAEQRERHRLSAVRQRDQRERQQHYDRADRAERVARGQLKAHQLTTGSVFLDPEADANGADEAAPRLQVPAIVGAATSHDRPPGAKSPLDLGQPPLAGLPRFGPLR